MSTDLFLIQSFETDNYKTDVYSDQNDANFSSIINNLYDNLNSCIYPRGIIELLLPTSGVIMLRVFDKDNNLILTSSKILPENINL